MRAYLAYTVLIGLLAVARPASAESDLIIYGPASVKTAAGKLGTVSPKSLDAACASDPGCIAKTGGEVNARRVLAITESGKKLTLMLVDVTAKLLIGTRDVPA